MKYGLINKVKKIYCYPKKQTVKKLLYKTWGLTSTHIIVIARITACTYDCSTFQQKQKAEIWAKCSNFRRRLLQDVCRFIWIHLQSKKPTKYPIKITFKWMLVPHWIATTHNNKNPIQFKLSTVYLATTRWSVKKPWAPPFIRMSFP